MSACRRQCSWRAFFFGGEEPNKFASPQARWPLLPGSFIAYRILIGIYQLAVFISLTILWGRPPLYNVSVDKAKWLIFISNWSFLVLTMYMTWAALTTCYWHLRGRKTAEVISPRRDDIPMKTSTTDLIQSGSVALAPHTPWYFKITWFLQVVSCSAELAVTLLYWVLEFDPGQSSLNIFTVHVHGVGAVLSIIDFLLVANPYRLLHLIYPILYAIVYFLFTYIYHAAGGRNPLGETHIYRGNLDWGTSPTRSLVTCVTAAFVGAPLMHLFFFILHLIKLAFSRCCGICTTNSSEE